MPERFEEKSNTENSPDQSNDKMIESHEEERDGELTGSETENLANEESTEENETRINRISESIDETRSKLDAAREQLNLPPVEKDPPSITRDKEELDRLRAKQNALVQKEEGIIDGRPEGAKEEEGQSENPETTFWNSLEETALRILDDPRIQEAVMNEANKDALESSVIDIIIKNYHETIESIPVPESDKIKRLTTVVASKRALVIERVFRHLGQREPVWPSDLILDKPYDEAKVNRALEFPITGDLNVDAEAFFKAIGSNSGLEGLQAGKDPAGLLQEAKVTLDEILKTSDAKRVSLVDIHFASQATEIIDRILNK